MRLAHLADTHLGFRQYHRQTRTGLNQREADVANAFRQVVDAIIAEAPEAVVIAGDVFHSVRPPNAAIVFAFQQLHRLRTALPEAAIVVIAGNHDTPRSTESGSILGLFTAAGVDVVADEARRLVYEALDLSILAVPHQPLMAELRPQLSPEGSARYQVLAVHGEVAGTFPSDRASLEYGGALLSEEDLASEQWTYVALGHYHVMHQVNDRAWYSGALDYVTTNPWGERKDEAGSGVPGKGWLLVDLETGTVERRWVDPPRLVHDLPVIAAEDLSLGEIDLLLRRHLESVPGGYDDQILRQVVENIPRHIARELDHGFVRRVKAAALHYRLDLRRPPPVGPIGLAPGGRRQTLSELWEDYLRRRPFPAELERETVVTVGRDLLEAVRTRPEEA